jgi:cold-inducible RNA-binding protein
MNIHVTNLSCNIGDADLMKIFSAYGAVDSLIIMRDKLNGRSKGVAMVDMINDSQARQAILCLDHTVLDGKTINVAEVRYSIRDYKN